MVDGGNPAELIKAFLPDADLHLIRASASENRLQSSPLAPADTCPPAAQTRRVADVVAGRSIYEETDRICSVNTSLDVCPIRVRQEVSYEPTLVPTPAQLLIDDAVENDRSSTPSHVAFAHTRSALTRRVVLSTT